MSKYDPLGHFLARSRHDQVAMTFSEIEGVLGFPLPEKSKRIRAWWSNNADNSVLTKVWLDAGFRSEQVDMASQKLVFRRVKPLSAVDGFSETAAAEPRAARRNPLFGWMKGTVTVAPGVDLTEPADPEWADIAEGKSVSEPELEKERG